MWRWVNIWRTEERPVRCQTVETHFDRPWSGFGFGFSIAAAFSSFVMFPVVHGVVNPVDLGFDAIETEYELVDFEPDLRWKVEKCSGVLRPGVTFTFWARVHDGFDLSRRY